jgi:hypothetical protein
MAQGLPNWSVLGLVLIVMLGFSLPLCVVWLVFRYL